MYRVYGVLLIILLTVTALTGCSVDARDHRISTLESENEALQARIDLLETSAAKRADSPLGTALDVVSLISVQDFASLSLYIHPTQGVRFSPYAYVDVQNDLLFNAQDITGLPLDSTVYTWGAYDGSGFPIELSFADYYSRFVYDEDFANPHMIGLNNIIGFGNTLVNISSVYPNGVFLEFHFTGFDPQYGGIDWRSLILVLEQFDGDWYLVGIVHNGWTI